MLWFALEKVNLNFNFVKLMITFELFYDILSIRIIFAYRVQERMELIKNKHLEASKPNPDAPKKPGNILVYKTKCACCGGSVLIGRHHTYSDSSYISAVSVGN